MSNATTPATIREEEAAHFGALAADWWDPKGSSAMLHRLNPVRLGFIREAVDAHWGCDPGDARPLAGKRALDAGCGAGLLCEPLARLGAEVTGVDAAAENIAAAKEHAAAMAIASPLPFRRGAGGGETPQALQQDNLPHPTPSPEGEGHKGGSITYLQGEIAALGLSGFDLVCSLEVIEHVASKGAFVAALAGAMQPDGLMVLSTPNRTVRSRLLLVEAAERLGAIPRGTHRWSDFLTPDELRELLAAAGLAMGEPRGISWSPAKGLHLSRDTGLNYIVTASKR
jgi:2-polyprenyl-6-hydroxyphenyl methylase / 3-demethylubiquinone-9 3-methyltransferase